MKNIEFNSIRKMAANFAKREAEQNLDLLTQHCTYSTKCLAVSKLSAYQKGEQVMLKTLTNYREFTKTHYINSIKTGLAPRSVEVLRKSFLKKVAGTAQELYFRDYIENSLVYSSTFNDTEYAYYLNHVLTDLFNSIKSLKPTGEQRKQVVKNYMRLVTNNIYYQRYLYLLDCGLETLAECDNHEYLDKYFFILDCDFITLVKDSHSFCDATAYIQDLVSSIN